MISSRSVDAGPSLGRRTDNGLSDLAQPPLAGSLRFLARAALVGYAVARQHRAMPQAEIKDWTWVLERRCPECGFDASTVPYERVPELLRENAAAWPAVLARADVRDRPAPEVWSPLEYAAHVRDAHVIFGERLALMLGDDDPAFANWDPDETAERDRYAEADPAAVGQALIRAADRTAAAFAAVAAGDLGRTGRRSDGTIFTVESLARYYVHDPIHHLHDVDR